MRRAAGWRLSENDNKTKGGEPMSRLSRIPNIANWVGKRALWIAGAGALLLVGGWAVIRAQQPATPLSTTHGVVQSFTTSPRGAVDGAVLDNGTRLHWPPHMQDRFRNLLLQGDQVRASGRLETGPAGETHFEVQSVTDLRTNRTAENPDFAAGPHGPGRRGRPVPPGPGAVAFGINNQDVRTITGAVRSMNTAPRGEIDGAQLDTGVLLHWPPHLQDQFRNLVAVGDRVQATGRMETGPAGDTHFEVQSVTDLRTNTTATNPDFVGGPPASGVQAVGAPQIPVELEQRLRSIEGRLDQLQHDIERLRESGTRPAPGPKP
jgi:hypothetical protein